MQGAIFTLNAHLQTEHMGPENLPWERIMGGVEAKVQELLANVNPAIPAGGNGVTRDEVASLVKTELMQRISPQTLELIVDSRIRQIL